MRSMMQDFRYALRRLRNAPGFAFTAICVLALGMGANIAVFTLVSGILLRPLPYPESDRVAQVGFLANIEYYSPTYANMLRLGEAMGSRFEFGAQFDSRTVSVPGP